MKTSEFWSALDTVFGPVLGRSLAADLYLPSCGGTAVEAINAGVAPDSVWEALVAESGAPPEARWVHRMDTAQRRTRYPHSM